MNTDRLKFMASHAGGTYAPTLAHFYIYNGRLQSGNGRYAVDCPCDLPAACVHADKLHAAFQACRGEPTATLGPTGYTVRSGKTRARLPVLDPATYPVVAPDAETEHTAPGIAAMLKRIAPFVAEDASRPWATSVCLKGGFAYATNNVVLCRVPFTAGFAESINIPLATVEAIISLGEPVGMGVSELSATFYFEDGTWVKTQLIGGDWPTGSVDQHITAIENGSWLSVNPNLHQAFDTAARISGERIPVVQFVNGGIALTDDTFATEELEPVPEAGRLNARMASLIFEYAEEIQWHSPKENVHAFRTGDLIGLFSGQR